MSHIFNGPLTPPPPPRLSTKPNPLIIELEDSLSHFPSFLPWLLCLVCPLVQIALQAVNNDLRFLLRQSIWYFIKCPFQFITFMLIVGSTSALVVRKFNRDKNVRLKKVSN